MTAEERITRLEAALYTLTQAILTHPEAFPKAALDAAAFCEMTLIQPAESE